MRLLNAVWCSSLLTVLARRSTGQMALSKEKWHQKIASIPRTDAQGSRSQQPGEVAPAGATILVLLPNLVLLQAPDPLDHLQQQGWPEHNIIA